MERVFRRIYDERLPLMKIQRTAPPPSTAAPPPPPKKKKKKSYLNFLLSETLYICFEDDKKDEIFFKKPRYLTDSAPISYSYC